MALSFSAIRLVAVMITQDKMTKVAGSLFSVICKQLNYCNSHGIFLSEYRCVFSIRVFFQKKHEALGILLVEGRQHWRADQRLA